ncbi:MAG: hypothetical protein HC905_20640 [Bacteroidales bacterium]|nr:hypothetical protein [Bacteroidales bacterium]
MKVKILITLLLSNLTIFYMYGQAHDTLKTNCPYTILKQGHYYSAIDPGDYIIKTTSGLKDYWIAAFGLYEPVPNVYFNNLYVIAINESFGTGGYRFQIGNIYETADKMIINIVIQEPKGIRTMAIERECIIFTAKRTNKKIEIIKTRL